MPDATSPQAADVMKAERIFLALDPEVDWLLFEWARWAKRRHWLSATCRSAEKFYSPELGEIWDDEPRPLPVDARQAWSVECIWRTVPFKERMTVKAAYITAPAIKEGTSTATWETHKRRHCRTLGLRRVDFEAYVVRGANMIHNRLRSQRLGNSIPSVLFRPLRQERDNDEPPSRAAFSLAQGIS